MKKQPPVSDVRLLPLATAASRSCMSVDVFRVVVAEGRVRTAVVDGNTMYNPDDCERLRRELVG